MYTSDESTTRREGRQKVTIAALAFLSLLGFAAAVHFGIADADKVAGLNVSRLTNERLLAEKLQLEKSLVETNRELAAEQDVRASVEQQAANMRRRVTEANLRTARYEAAARGRKRSAKEVNELNTTIRELQAELVAASTTEHDLREEVASITKRYDALASEFEAQKATQWSVENAEVDAHRGKKGRLTVVARRTREIRMAFDLPNSAAPGASFRITAPDGRNYTVGDPAISWTIDPMEPEPLAALATVPLDLSDDRTARVQLKFISKDRLQPGPYRIDVMVGGAHLNTVLLNLR